MRIGYIGILALLPVIALAGWRGFDHLADRAEMRRLLALQPTIPKLFQPVMVANLPEPAQRYFMFSIAEGTPILPVAEFRMTGLFSLGNKDQPNYMKMEAHQVLAAPYGFVWKMKAQGGHLGFSGSDSAAWTRFWMGGLLPVARAGGDGDHARAAFGRYIAEAVFWTPAAILPGPDVDWQATGSDGAKVTVRHAGMSQSVSIEIANDGQPL